MNTIAMPNTTPVDSECVELDAETLEQVVGGGLSLGDPIERDPSTGEVISYTFF